MGMIAQTHENEQRFSRRVTTFFKHYQLGGILRKCNAYKQSGIPVVDIVMDLFCLVFRNRSMYPDMKSGRNTCDFRRDAVYRLKNSLYVNWRRFVTLLGARRKRGEKEQQITALFEGLKAKLPVDCAFLPGVECSDPGCA